MECRYCNKQAEWVDNATVYGKRYGKSYMMWICRPCDARVGCHNNTKEPLGILANAELRKIKMEVKNAWIKKELGEWGEGNSKAKGEAYKKLADQLGIKVKYCHFGYFGIETCQKIKKLLNN
jgi:uncharacterized protein YlaI